MSDSLTRYRTFAAVTPGLEALLDEELAELCPGVRRTSLSGGVELMLDRTGLWRIILSARLAESVRVRVGRFAAHNFDELEEGLRRIPWSAYLSPRAEPVVRVTCRRSALYHSDAVAERVSKVIRARSRGAESGVTPVEPSDGWPDLYVRVVRDRVAVSVEAGGRLHRRGYREHIGAAPLRETLAAALVRAARLGPAVTVWDPFCGSGTVVIEAVVATTRAPGAPGRSFALERWPTHDGDAFGAFISELEGRRRPPTRLGIGTDRDPKVIAAARYNAGLAGVESAVRFETGDVEEAVEAIPNGSALLTNLPYGHRTRGGAELTRTLRRLGNVLRRRADCHPVVVLNGHVLRGPGRLDGLTGLTWERLSRFRNRGLAVEMLRLRRE